MTNFFPSEEICTTKRKIFGLCDAPTPPGGKAYLDEDNGEKWVAVVHNESQEAVSFVPIDHCIDLRKPDGKMDNRCDCCLFHHDTIAFVELKKRGGRDTRWIIEGVEQLRATIKHFEKEDEAKAFRNKKAYIANSMRPLFRSAQAGRMERFSNETGYVLRIESHIKDL